jgi:hypothetical protein
VRTGVHKGAHTSVLSHQQHVRVGDTRSNPSVLGQGRTVEDGYEFLGQCTSSVRHTDTLTIHKIAAEICGAQNNRVAHPSARPSGIVRVPGP